MTGQQHTSVSFTGHRTYDGQADELLCRAIEELHAAGRRRFLSGMAAGFDLAAAEAVLRCREHLPGLRLVAVVPFEGQQARFSAAVKERYRRVLEAADECVVLSESYHPGCYAVRNEYLVAQASLLVAWYDGSPGGTHFTLRRALAQGRRVVNLHPSVRVTVQPVQAELF